MKPLSLDTVRQEQFDASEAIVVDLIRDAYPVLDQRRGTVIRDHLVRPAATLSARTAAEVEQVRINSSLQLLAQSDNPDISAVNALLGNYGMSLDEGRPARGTIRVTTNANRVYTVAEGAIFRASDGRQYGAAEGIVARLDPAPGEVALVATASSFYFDVPVVAEESGSEYNIEANVVMAPAFSLYGFVEAETLAPFSAGLNKETVQQAVGRIPAALSHRGFTSRTATEAQIRAEFVGSGTQIHAVSVQGYGDPAQLRDKHNVFGIAVGGRMDVYVRTYGAPAVKRVVVQGQLVDPGVYRLEVEQADAAGVYAVRAVSDVDSGVGGSYTFSVERKAVPAPEHDFSAVSPEVETFGTVYQSLVIQASGVSTDGNTRDFAVELYANDAIPAIQAYADDPAVRNVFSDIVVRAPLLVLVSCTVTAECSRDISWSEKDLEQLLIDYINSRSFVGTLSRSELVSVLFSAGVSRIPLSAKGFALHGRVLGADGAWRELSSDTLDISRIADGSALITPDTCVFGAEVGSVQVSKVIR